MTASDAIAGLGPRTAMLVCAPPAELARLSLTPEELMLCAIIGRGTSIQETLERSGFAESHAISLLLGLRQRGVLEGEAIQEMASKEPDLPADRRADLDERFSLLGRQNHFEALSLAPGAPPDEVKRAYYELSKRYHPDRFFGRELGPYVERIDAIFKRLSEAQQTLCDPVTRKQYLEEHPELAPQTTRAVPPSRPPPPAAPEPDPVMEFDPVAERRSEERRSRFKHHPYLNRSSRPRQLIERARESLEKNDLQGAILDLQVAAQLDPHGEAPKLLVSARRKAEKIKAAEEASRARSLELGNDLGEALEAFKAAAKLDPENGAMAHKVATLMLALEHPLSEAKIYALRAVEAEPEKAEYRLTAAEILLTSGAREQARAQAEKLLKLVPDSSEAKKLLKKTRGLF